METANREEILKAEAAIREMAEEISRYSTHSRQAEAAVNNITAATQELVIIRDKLDIFLQKNQGELQETTAKFTCEAKNTAGHLIQFIDQQNKENDRLSQTNNQLQELSKKFIDITENLNSIIEKIRLSLVEELESFEKKLTPSKDTIAKQESALSQLTNDFNQLNTNLSDISKSIEKSFGDTALILNKLEINNDNIILNREMIEKFFKNENDQILSIENFQFKMMKMLKWNMALIVFTFFMISGSVIFLLMK